MKYTINKKEIGFKYLTEEDINEINEQIESYENENGGLTFETLYNPGLVIESVLYGIDEYHIEVNVNDDSWDAVHPLIDLEIGDTTKEIADDTASEISRYLVCKLINEEIKKL